MQYNSLLVCQLINNHGRRKVQQFLGEWENRLWFSADIIIEFTGKISKLISWVFVAENCGKCKGKLKTN
jgi:hypothetical protein